MNSFSSIRSSKYRCKKKKKKKLYLEIKLNKSGISFLYLCAVWSFIEIFSGKCHFGLTGSHTRIVDARAYSWIRTLGVDVINPVDEESTDSGRGLSTGGQLDLRSTGELGGFSTFIGW